MLNFFFEKQLSIRDCRFFIIDDITLNVFKMIKIKHNRIIENKKFFVDEFLRAIE